MISVCIATYNGEKHIKEQLLSILCQLGAEDEIIVSDDGSSDNTLAIIENFNDSRIKIFAHQQKKQNLQNHYKVAANFENALKQVKGNHIFLSDQDDVWLPNKVETILPFLKQNNFVISDAFIVDEKLTKIGKISDYRPYKKGFFRNLHKSAYMGCTCAFPKTIKNYVLPFPTKLIGQDYWIGLLAELKFNVVYIPEPLILYRKHQNNVSNAGEKSTKSFWYMFNYRFVLFFQILKKISQ